MIMVSENLKKKFVKDFNIPIKVFDDEYFLDRLHLFEESHNAYSLYQMLLCVLENYESEEDFLKEINSVVDQMIEYILSNEKYKEFNSMDMNPYSVKTNISSKNVYNGNYVGKHLISIDMKKANFSSLKHFGVFDEFATYDEFVRHFTNNEYIIKSKHLRVVVFGKVNHGRLATYEKYQMKRVYDLLEKENLSDYVVILNNDEIILDVSSLDNLDVVRETIHKVIESFKDELPFEFEEFELLRVLPISSYVKKFIASDYFDGDGYEIKATDAMYVPMVTRFVSGQEQNEKDLVFEYDGLMARFLKTQPLRLVDRV